MEPIKPVEYKKSPIKRIKAIDTVRGMATMEMIIYHFVTWYLPQIPKYSLIHFIVITIFGHTLRFCFVTIPAMGVTLQLYRSKIDGIDESLIRNSIFKRGLLLIIIQFVCNFFGWHPFFTWNSFILSFVGISIIIAYYVSKLSHRTRIILIIIIALITPFLKFYLHPIQFQMGFIQNVWTIDTFLYSMFLQVDFPILPYIIFSIFGTIFTEKMISAVETKSEEKFIKNSLIIAIISLVLYSIFTNFRSIINYPDFFLGNPPRQDILFAIGSVILFIIVCFWIQDWKQEEVKALEIFEIFGSISLTTFITHYYIFQRIFDIIYDPWLNLDPYSVYLLSIILWISHVIYGIIVLRNKRKYSVEWFIRSCV
ncbi:MAG: heparan-alpha-glucosaminide N-acetyltransferase domain-containing protein [Candidatus Hodarchaeota archaeon]